MRLSLLALLPVAPALVGCAGVVSTDGATDAEPTATTSAIVVVERTVDPAKGARAEANARFVRVAASSSIGDALRAIGAALDLPARGACASISSLSGPGTAESSPVVELLDVGAVSLEADGLGTQLAPRQLPDVTDVVSGVVYARAPDSTLLPAGVRYVTHVAGSPDVGSFELTALAPGDPSDVRISGEDEGQVTVGSAPVALSWQGTSGSDVLYVDIRPGGVRCAFDDSGSATIAPILFDGAGTLVIHRLHRELVTTHGVDSGEVRFDFARNVSYARE